MTRHSARPAHAGIATCIQQAAAFHRRPAGTAPALLTRGLRPQPAGGERGAVLVAQRPPCSRGDCDIHSASSNASNKCFRHSARPAHAGIATRPGRCRIVPAVIPAQRPPCSRGDCDLREAVCQRDQFPGRHSARPAHAGIATSAAPHKSRRPTSWHSARPAHAGIATPTANGQPSAQSDVAQRPPCSRGDYDTLIADHPPAIDRRRHSARPAHAGIATSPSRGRRNIHARRAQRPPCSRGDCDSCGKRTGCGRRCSRHSARPAHAGIATAAECRPLR